MNSKVTQLNITLGQDQEYSNKDIALIESVQLQRKFGLPEDYIEFHLYDLNKNLLKSNYNFTSYKNSNNIAPSPSNLVEDLVFDPTQDAINAGYDYGSIINEYNIFRRLFGSNKDNKFYIKFISTDRTELRIANNNVSNLSLESFYNDFIISFNNTPYYKDFYLNLGNNRLLIGVNIVLEKDPNQFNLLIKLYEPLPEDITLKDQFWLVDKLSTSIDYQVDFIIENQNVEEVYKLRGPNFNIKINEEVNPSIDYVNYDSLLSTTSTSSYQQLKSLLEEKSLEINVDYTEYENFIHFSSAKERLLNFVYKLQLLENYNRDLNTLETVTITPQVSSSKSIIKNNINNIIEKFDGYEYFLYFESGSKAWPKSNNTKPYVNYSTTSSISLTWLGSDNSKEILYGGQLYSASVYDSDNSNNLLYSIPEYLRIDSQNKDYELFLHMIGQHFDNIWLHAKGITDLHKAQNSLVRGISKDLVSYALKSLGIKLYSNTNTTENPFFYLLGITNSGSYQYPTGSELITEVVTSSQYTLAGSEVDKEVFKRLYHNLPYLLKTKGTERGIRALISCYGIPDTILRINEFGGVDKESGSFEQYFNRLSYGLSTKTGSIYLSTPWAPSYHQSLSSSLESGSIVPDTIEFRFKTNGIPSSSTTFHSQSLFQVGSGSSTQFGIQLLYNPLTSTGSYGDYGSIRLTISGNNGYIFSDPINLPYFNKDWWNIMIYRETGSLVSSNVNTDNKYWVYVANSIYNGHDGETIGYIGSASIFISGSTSSSYNRSWNLYNTSSFSSYLGGQNSNNIISSNSSYFNGVFQELRYWITPLPVENFIGHTLSPLSIECINETGSYNKLIFRLPLGTDLYISNSLTIPSTHPSIEGLNIIGTGSFIMGSSIVSSGQIYAPGLSLYGVAIYGQDVYYGLGSNVVYLAGTEFYYLKSGNLGLGKPVNDKIRIVNNEIISGSTLSSGTNIEQYSELNSTKDINTVEISFSPQDQINNDIIYQLGFFNIDEYIGDPRESSHINYSKLDSLRKFYFQKYIESYNYYDFIRLLRYFNNSLFKLIKDFSPARANVSTGIVIKPHLLERSKYKRNEPTLSNTLYSQSIDVLEVDSDEGGILKENYNYAFTQSINSLLGNINKINTHKFERYTGEISGSTFTVTNQSLQPDNIYIKRPNTLSINNFIHSDYHILLNNITQSRLSTKYFDLDYSTNPLIATNLNLVISQSNIVKAPIQDSNYTLQRHINPRYIGSKTYSTLYNTYTVGDSSYGQTAAIDSNVRKLGLFTNVTNSLFLGDKSEIQLKYLVDELGNLTELNTQNINWFEIQNTFKRGEILNIAQFDTLKYSDQRRLDGYKNIWLSGYSFLPILYFSSEDTTILIQPTSVLESSQFNVSNTNIDKISSGSVTASLYRTINQGGSNWITTNNPPVQYYEAPNDGQYSFHTDLTISASHFVNIIRYNIVTTGTPYDIELDVITIGGSQEWTARFTNTNGTRTLEQIGTGTDTGTINYDSTNELEVQVQLDGLALDSGYVEWHVNGGIVGSPFFFSMGNSVNETRTLSSLSEGDTISVIVQEG